VPDILRLTTKILQTDNEQNGVIALRIMYDIHKMFNPAPEELIQSFFEFYHSMYESFESTVASIFSQVCFPISVCLCCVCVCVCVCLLVCVLCVCVVCLR